MRLILMLAVLAVAGCSAVSHRPAEQLVAGRPLAVAIDVNPKQGQTPAGQLHYRFNHGDYRSTALKQRAGELWAVLPTESLQPGDVVAYYADVTLGEQPYALASPAKPYTVRVLDYLDAALAQVRMRVTYGRADEPVRFELSTAEGAVDAARLYYTMPGLPGEVTAAMEPIGWDRFELRVAPEAVAAGAWRWRVKVSVEGQWHTPPGGHGRFSVDKPTDEN